MDRESVILKNMALVKNIASKFSISNLGVDYDDLVSVGVLGLLDAYDRYDGSKGAKFTTYATLRVRAYIIDEIRRLSPITRTDMSKVKKYNESVKELSLLKNSIPKDSEIANIMGVSVKDIKHIEESINILNITSLDRSIGGDSEMLTLKDVLVSVDTSPSNRIEEDEMLDLLTHCIDRLDYKDKLLIALYYFEELTLKEVGEVIGLSESRVSVLHHRALKRLKVILKENNYINEGCVM